MMRNILKSLLIGIVAGVIDVTPMILQDANLYACISAFIHWLVLGVIIPFVSWNIKPWLKGGIIGIISSLSVISMVMENEPESIIPILLFSTIIGIFVGIAGDKFIKQAQ